MSNNSIKPRIALVLDILIIITFIVLAVLVRNYADDGWRDIALFTLLIVASLFSISKIIELVRYVKTTDETGLYKPVQNEVSALVLINEETQEIKTWDLRGKTGLVIGRGDGDCEVDIDLSETEYFSLISNQHAALNYTGKGWMLTDAGSQNGTSIIRRGAAQNLLITPGAPVPIRIGDTICIAEETRLAVK